MSDNPYRLPRTAVPSRYELSLEPDLDSASFEGTEVVHLEIQEGTEKLVLNAAELEIVEAFVVTKGGRRLAADPTYDEKLERVTLLLEDQAEPGPAQFHARFRGVLNDQLRGFYRSVFNDEDGIERPIATTQFEASSARRAFPCWDEPDLKATFSVTLVVPEQLMAISNAREIGREAAGDGKVAVQFAETVRMSTYLVAFVVGPFEVTEPIDVDGVPMRVVCPTGKLHLTSYALEAGAFSLRYFTDYYGIPYPGDKVDFIAIPDFAHGAMENLGAITYRESLLLVDPDRVGQHELMRIADVIAHELAHMWFGDLVTMKWWNGIWLNEAFATFMEMKAVDAYRPNWKRWLSFATKQGLLRSAERFDALDNDALEATRPVEYEVISPDDADGMFDALTYGKGSAVLRMLEQYLGEDTFRDGIRHYLQSHRYGNTETADLWRALEEVAGEPVRDMMDTWIFQPGFPLVLLKATEGGFEASQRRFTYVQGTHPERWKVPLVVKSAEGRAISESRTLLSDPVVVSSRESRYVLVNGGGYGFFRTSYPDGMLTSITASLDDLSELEQFVVIDDARALLMAGEVSGPDFLDLAFAYRGSEEVAIWQVLLAGIEELFHILDPSSQQDLGRFVRELLSRQYERLGLEPVSGEDDLAKRLRGSIVMALGRLADDPAVVEAARTAFHKTGDEPGAVDPEVAYASIFITASHGDEKTFDEFVDRYESAATPQERNRFLFALAEFPSPDLAARSVAMTLDGTIRSQDGPYFVSRLLYNRKLHPPAWNLVTENWEQMLATYPPVSFNHVLDYMPALSEPDLAHAIEAFLDGQTFPHSDQFLARRLEELAVHRALRQRESGRLAEYLAIAAGHK